MVQDSFLSFTLFFSLTLVFMKQNDPQVKSEEVLCMCKHEQVAMKVVNGQKNLTLCLGEPEKMRNYSCN